MARKKPMHKQIAEKLRQRIAAGSYEADGLPPEMSLMEDYGVSRHTIRQAMQNLVNDGLIERRAGSGTRVSKRAMGGFWAIGALSELIGEFTVDQYKTLSTEVESAQNHPQVAAMLGLRKTGRVFHITRILRRNELPYALANIFTTAEHGTAVPEELIDTKPMIDLIQEHASLRATRARQLASATSASKQAAKHLGIPVGAPVLVLHRTYFDSSDQTILHAELFCRPDRYNQIVDYVHEDKRTQSAAIQPATNGTSPAMATPRKTSRKKLQ